jgi:hypothetical protein
MVLMLVLILVFILLWQCGRSIGGDDCADRGIGEVVHGGVVRRKVGQAGR